MNRRHFFGNLGVLIAAAAAPTIFIPKNPINWGKPLLYVPKRRVLKATWSVELEQDLKAYHNADASSEFAALLMEQAKLEFPNSKVVSVHKSDEYVDMASSWLSPQKHVYVEILEVA